ncbi:hypothetical protein C3432_18160 [Citrobacter amalonaticus]|uniref:Putative surface-exposed virulence protein BigA beta-sandwich domain-containing protein n=1 Tax=Citrobacter amalonaticus TaxID=35703 RepID=A0A2S4RWW7_CITAM|nr:hypothetical protein C3432_18160 [Citrobacter amalonaticus]POT74222.1 hypothetical protein C3436_15800 [Citrobacter amalonaticus]POU65023.1 hypothetical protein C3430_12540 [Citrobacter amalonaticus]POV03857.1 hypothetical protein C3424_17480 [Citrobacter amalonaticus]
MTSSEPLAQTTRATFMFGDSATPLQGQEQADGTWLITDAAGNEYVITALDQTTGKTDGYVAAHKNADGVIDYRGKWQFDEQGNKVRLNTYTTMSGLDVPEGAPVTLSTQGSLTPVIIENTGETNARLNDGNDVQTQFITIKSNTTYLMSGDVNLEIVDNGNSMNGFALDGEGARAIVGKDSTLTFSNGDNNTSATLAYSPASQGYFDNYGTILLSNGSPDQVGYTTYLTDGAKPGVGGSGKLDFTNHSGATITLSNALSQRVYLWLGAGNFVNDGTITATGANVTVASAHSQSQGEPGTLTNNGTITINGDNATVFQDLSGTTSVNNGTINLGLQQDADLNATGMTAFQSSTSDAVAINGTTGVVNIYANDSAVFDRGGSTSTARLINYGQYNIAPDVTGSSLVRGEADSVVQNTVQGYTVGTTASGTYGTYSASSYTIKEAKVNTGFVLGTSAQSVTMDNVFTGQDIQGEENIASTSAVWRADASKDSSGNVDVTMTKNAYTDVVTDSNVSDMAQALDAGYTNNALYNSLNLETAGQVTDAMRQLSGMKAVTANRESRVLSNRFNMMQTSGVKTESGLGFNVIAQNDSRAELGNNARFDMLSLSQRFDLSPTQNLSMQYGMARIVDGQAKEAGDNGLTGGFSQFFGMQHDVQFADDVMLSNSLRYDLQQLQSDRLVSYGAVNTTGSSDSVQQYLEWRSQFSKSFSLSDELSIAPLAGVKFRHGSDNGMDETGAGDFNLQMSGGSKTAVDATVGLKLDYQGSNGWAVNAMVEGSPNLTFSQSQRSGELQGAAGQRFAIDSGEQGGGINSFASVGVNYLQKNSQLRAEAFSWREDGLSDKGMMLNYGYQF